MDVTTAGKWIEHLELKPHPEGGFYRETYRSIETAPSEALPARFMGSRNFSTAIYFLLRSEDRSVFHRIKSDELWHFYDGSPLDIFILHDSVLQVRRLGKNAAQNELPQIVVPAGCWFGAKVAISGSFTLVGCTVSPGFDFRDFEMAERADLLREFPNEKDIIVQLT